MLPWLDVCDMPLYTYEDSVGYVPVRESGADYVSNAPVEYEIAFQSPLPAKANGGGGARQAYRSPLALQYHILTFSHPHNPASHEYYEIIMNLVPTPTMTSISRYKQGKKIESHHPFVVKKKEAGS